MTAQAPTTAMPEGMDAQLWSVLSERARNFLARHPDALSILDVVTYRHLPAFVDLAWVKAKLDVAAADAAAAHTVRGICRNVVSLTDWPDTPELTADDMAVVHLQAMRLPLGLHRLSQAWNRGYVEVQLDPAAQFAGFQAWIEETVRLAGGTVDEFDLCDHCVPEILQGLLDKDERDRARDLAVLAVMSIMTRTGLQAVSDRFGGRIPGLAEHVAAYREFLRRFAATLGGTKPYDPAKADEIERDDIENVVLEINADLVRNLFARVVRDIDNDGLRPVYEMEGADAVDGERPAVPLPSFVGREWLKDRLALSGAVRSQLHQGRDQFAPFAPAGWWPPEKPATDVIADRLLEALSLPHVLTVANCAVLPRADEELGTWDTSPFRPFYRKIAAVLRGGGKDAGSAYGDANGMADVRALDKLVGLGHVDLAREFAVLRGAELYDEDFLPLLRDREEDYAEVVAFLEARRRLKAWSDRRTPCGKLDAFRRLADCEIQTSSPNAPPCTRRRHPQAPRTWSFGRRNRHQEENMASAEAIPNILPDATEPARPQVALAAPRAGWEKCLSDVSIHALALASADPDATAIAELRALLDGAEAAALEWEAARPKRVDATPYVERLRGVRADLARMIEDAGSEHVAAEVPPVATIGPDDVEDVGQAVDAAAGDVQAALEAEIHVGGLNTAMGAETRLVRKAAFGAEIAAAVGVLLERIDTGVRSLDAAATLLSASGSEDAVPPQTTVVATVPEVPASVEATHDAQVVAAQPEADERQEEAPAAAAPAPVVPSDALASAAAEAELPDDLDLEEGDLDVEEGDLALMATLVAVDAVLDLPAEAEAVEPPEQRVNTRLLELVRSREFGLAHHLAAAARAVDPEADLVVGAEEMRFAAASGRLDHAFLQTAPEAAAALVETGLTALDAIPSSSEGPVAAARRILMYPTALEIVLFHPDTSAVEMVRGLNGLVEEVQEEHARLVDAATAVARSRLPLSPAVLGHVSNTIEAHTGADAMRARTLELIDAFSRTAYSFQLATRVRTALYQSDGLVGLLRDAMQGKDAAATEAAATTFVKATASRSLILDAFDRAEIAVCRQYRGIDGPARDRMIAHVEDIRDAASEYLGRRMAARIVSAQDTPRIREAVSELRKRLADAVAAFRRLEGAESAVLAAAAGFAADRYEALDIVLAGDVRAVDRTAHAVALHGSLPLLETLQFGRSWQPSPYEAAEIVEAVLASPQPLLPPQGAERDAAYEAVVRRRIEDGSLVGAQMLIDLAEEHGISDACATGMAQRFPADVEAAKEELAREAGDARALIERVMRFGSLTRPEEAQRLISVVDRVVEAQVPVAVDLDDREDRIDAERIYDVRIASALLAEASEEARALLEEPRGRLIDRIDAMAARLPAEDVRHMRSLCAEDDLLTAEEIVALAESQGSIVGASAARAGRLEVLERTTLPAAVAQGRNFAEAVAAAIAAGDDVPGAPFSQLSPSRRERSGEIFAAWRELFRHLEGGIGGTTLAEEAGAFLEALGIAFRLREVSKLSSATRRLFVADWEGGLPTDAESHLLPDFGSLTHGGWRTAVTTTLPGDAVLTQIAKSAGSSGILLLVAEVVSQERRERFLLQNLAARRRIVLVDSASLVQALAEPELRALTPVELGQPYSYAWPFRDFGREAVPPELFVGRRQEMETLFEAGGSCVVYGGRRIGKTALLKHLVATRNDPANGTLVAFVDAQEIGSSHLPKKIWDDLQKALPAIFEKKAVGSDPRRVAEEIERWLKADPRRRIVVLIDEADDFVRSDAAQSFAVFHALQTLMSNTGRRFKLVLSGLHNVTRLAQVGNSPVLQISSNPQRIGPLMGEELKDAEDLVVRPFAALGIRFERREDVWRLLSHANYYPVLAQTLAKHLLEQVVEESVRTDRVVRVITRGLVSRIFDTRQVREEVKEKFLMTLRIDLRYELLAFVVADLVLGNEASGVIEEGVSVRLIRDHALECWPKGFSDPNRVSLFEDLVDEMEGLGILRQVSADRWTLRSTAVTRLLGTRDEVGTKLLEFMDREGPNEFDPKSHRRQLEPAVGYEKIDRRPSPLTLVQERDLIADPTPVKVVFGTAMADVDLVSLALRTAPGSFSDGSRFDLVAQVFADRREFLDRLKQVRGGGERQTVVVVDVRTAWEPGWIVDALKVRPVVEKAAKVVFVGSAGHAAAYASDPRFVRLTTVRAMPLEPWSAAFLDAQLMRTNAVVGGDVRDALYGALGGWNGPLSQVLHAGKGERLAHRVEKLAAEIEASPDTPVRLGIDGPFREVVDALAEYHGASNPFHAGDVAVLFEEVLPDLAREGGQLSGAEAAIAYGVLIGAFVPLPSARNDEATGSSYALAPLVRRLVAPVERKEAA